MASKNRHRTAPTPERADFVVKLHQGTSKSGSGRRPRMKVYQFNFPEDVIGRFRGYCTMRGLSLAAGVRLVVLEYMEKHEL